MSVPGYASYLDSGVEWLGEIPSHWTTVQTKRAFRRRKTINNGMACEDRLALTMSGVVPRDLNDLDGLQSNDYEGYQIFEAGDLVFKLIDLQNIKTSRVGMVPSRGIMSPAYIRLEPSTQEVARYGFWYFMALYWTQVFNNLGGGVRQTLGPEDLLTVAFPLPSPEEQVAIAAFLDWETGKIDALVEAQRRLIELLKEKRQAVISHAVTKGLDPTAPMKDSGVEWLAEVPAHWTINKLKRLTPAITVGIVVEPSKYYADEGVPALRSLNVKPGRIEMSDLVFISDDANELLSKSKLRTGDLVAVRTGQPGTTAIVPPELDGCNCIDLIVIRKPFGSERYLCWYLASDAAVRQFSEGSGGAIQQHFNVGMAVNLLVPDVPREEQEAIAVFLDSETAKLDSLVDEAVAAMRFLKERRTALISAAVTGKIDVRGLVVREIEAA